MKGLLKRAFLDTYITTSFSVCSFGNTYLWGSSFWSKYPQVDLDFRNVQKNIEMFFCCFLDNFIWIGCVKLSLLKREYLPLEKTLKKALLKNQQIAADGLEALNQRTL